MDGNEPGEEIAVCSRKLAAPNSAFQNSSGFSTTLGIHASRPCVGTKQTIDFKGQERWFRCAIAGNGYSACLRDASCTGPKKRSADDYADRPRRQSIEPITEVNIIGRSLPRNARSARDITAEGEAPDRSQNNPRTRKNYQSSRGVTPGRRR
jgi:hypothetical protein